MTKSSALVRFYQILWSENEPKNLFARRCTLAHISTWLFGLCLRLQKPCAADRSDVYQEEELTQLGLGLGASDGVGIYTTCLATDKYMALASKIVKAKHIPNPSLTVNLIR